jgi:hypothetical protein
LCSPHSLQHVLDRAFDLRELLCIAGAQHHIRVGPVLWIEERIAPDRDRRIGFGDLAELRAARAPFPRACECRSRAWAPPQDLGLTHG